MTAGVRPRRSPAGRLGPDPEAWRGSFGVYGWSPRSGRECRTAAGRVLVMACRRAGKDPQPDRAIAVAADDEREGGRDLVVTNDEVVARMRVEWNPSVPKVPGHDAGLVLLMVVDPQLDRRLLLHDDKGRPGGYRVEPAVGLPGVRRGRRALGTMRR